MGTWEQGGANPGKWQGPGERDASTGHHRTIHHPLARRNIGRSGGCMPTSIGNDPGFFSSFLSHEPYTMVHGRRAGKSK
jgi:hypothetical protein